MSKKMKVLIAVLVAIITLTVSGAVAVLAQEDEELEPEDEELIEETDEILPRVKFFMATMESDGLLSRVAEILGISEAELSDAFAQAKQEMMAERWEKAFFMMRPQPEPLTNNGWKGFEGIKRNIQQRLKEFRKPELRMEMLEKAIEEGLITEENADEIKAWTGNKPAALNQMSPKPRIMKAVRGRQSFAVHEGWQGPLPYQEKD